MSKQHILEEIKRTFQANGGVPIGRGRFEAETGIKPSEVLRYWARWGDAVAEAGFAANQMVKKTDETILLAHLAVLTRKFGRFPVSTELKLEAKGNPDLPSHTVFSAMGSKQERIKKLRDFCRSNPIFSDVIPLIGAEQTGEDEAPVDTAVEDGWVYMMRSGRHYKIGFSVDVGRRAKEIRTELPERMSEVHRIRTDDPSGIEAYWHNRFKDKRKNGEWFELNASDVRIFKKRKFM